MGTGMLGAFISLSAANPEGDPELVISDTPLIDSEFESRTLTKVYARPRSGVRC